MLAAQGMYHADRIDDELASPPADWLVLTREYATQSGDVAAMEPDNANGWYDRARQELHLVVGTQSPQEVAEGVAAMLATSRIGLKRLFLHPCFTVGYGSKDHCPMPYYGVLAAVYGDGRPVRFANDRFEQFQAGLKRHKFRRGLHGRGRPAHRPAAIVSGEHRRQWRRPGELLLRPHHGRRHLGAVGLLSSEVGRRRDRDFIARDRLRRGARLRRAGNHDGDRADGRRDRP